VNGPQLWSFESLKQKAQLYFTRAEETTRHDSEFSLWVLLGIEHLQRAALAKVSPTLLAAPEGSSLLHALGYQEGTRDPKSVLIKTVSERLAVVIPEFTDEHKEMSARLAALRNAELHTGDPALEAMTMSVWMPDFFSLASVLSQFLGDPLEDIVGENLAQTGAALRADADAKLRAQVQREISAARTIFDNLTPGERTARAAALLATADKRACPACRSNAKVELTEVRSTSRRVDEDDTVFWDDIFVISRLNCPVCGLSLDSLAETRSAGLTDEILKENSVSLEDRYDEYVAEMEYEYQNE